MKVILVVGARPNFMKIAPLCRAIRKRNQSIHDNRYIIHNILVHTGQHYDYEMSKIFFEDLELPEPDIYLGVGSGTHAEQTGRIMIELEKMLLKEKPDLLVVVGDVNSTLAGALTAVKLHIPVAHVEAGLRSFDRTMPEEINRLLTDAISDYLFTPSPDANENLKKEGIEDKKIFLVGNIMIDSLLSNMEKVKKSGTLKKFGLKKEQSIDDRQQTTDYALLTLHRPTNVDDKDAFGRIINALIKISQHVPIIFPVHPRTKKQMQVFGFQHYFVDLKKDTSSIINNGLYLTDPLSYSEFLNLMAHAKMILTDSGGIQEETTVLDIPCLTLRENTEWPITITQGTNVLVGNDTQKIENEAFKVLNGKGKKGNCSELWDGKASDRIIEVLLEQLVFKG